MPIYVDFVKNFCLIVIQFMFCVMVIFYIIGWLLMKVLPSSKYKIVNKFIKQKVAIHCQTEEEAEKFIHFCMKENKMAWKNIGQESNIILKPKFETSFYDKYKNETCYSYGQKGKKFWRLYAVGLTYSNYQTYVDNGFEIISFKGGNRNAKKLK